MIRATVLYPNTEGSWFDMDYYLHKHIPLIKNRLTPVGLVRVELEEGLSGMAPGTPAPYWVIGSLNFHSLEEWQNAVAMHGEELIGDIPNYTNVQAQIFISRVLDTAQTPSPMASTAV